MINRCKYCDDIAPDFSDMCDSCAFIEQNCKEDATKPIIKEDDDERE